MATPGGADRGCGAELGRGVGGCGDMDQQLLLFHGHFPAPLIFPKDGFQESCRFSCRCHSDILCRGQGGCEGPSAGIRPPPTPNTPNPGGGGKIAPTVGSQARLRQRGGCNRVPNPQSPSAVPHPRVWDGQDPFPWPDLDAALGTGRINYRRAANWKTGQRGRVGTWQGD